MELGGVLVGETRYGFVVLDDSQPRVAVV
jgi:hypothetical protein